MHTLLYLDKDSVNYASVISTPTAYIVLIFCNVLNFGRILAEDEILGCSETLSTTSITLDQNRTVLGSLTTGITLK